LQRLTITDDVDRKRLAGRIFGALSLVVVIGYRFAVTSTNRTVGFALTHAEPDGWLTYGMTQLGIAIATAAVACGVLALVPKRMVGWAGLVVMAVQSLMFAVGVNTSVPSTLLYPSTPETEFVSKNLGDGRVWCVGDGSANYQSRLVPNSAMSLGWRDIAGSDPLTLKTYEPIAGQLDQAQLAMPPAGATGSVASVRPLLNRLNVKYIISPRPLGDTDLTQAYSGDVYVYENPSAFGLARLQSSPSSSIPVKVQADLPGLINLVNQNSQAGMLTTSVVYDSAWRVTVDGKKGHTVADSLYLATPVTVGTHQIEFLYQPVAIEAGLFISCISWLLVGTLTVVRRIS
jgi:hypothetical protein